MLTTATAVGAAEITNQNAAPDATRPNCWAPCSRTTASARPTVRPGRGWRPSRTVPAVRGCREWVGYRLADLPQRVAIDVIDQTLTVGDAQRGVLLVRPRPIVVDCDAHAEADRVEGAVEEWVRQDAVDLG